MKRLLENAALAKTGGALSETKKPIVTFSDNFKTATCTTWKKSESRVRARQANNILGRLYENWKNGNKPIPFPKLRVDKEITRLDKDLDAKKYPQTFALIVQCVIEKTGERTAKLSDEYDYKAT